MLRQEVGITFNIYICEFGFVFRTDTRKVSVGMEIVGEEWERKKNKS